MALLRMYCMCCDICGDTCDYEHYAKRARELARASGWIKRNGQDICSECVKKEEKDGTK